jgi:hypothetical protein
MATQATLVSESDAQPSTTKMPRLPLGDLGFTHVPGVPVDAAALEDTLIKLTYRLKQSEQPLQGLSKTFTIGGSTARAYNFLFGTADADGKQAAAHQQMLRSLSRDSSEIVRILVNALKTPPAQPARGGARGGEDLTALALDDPKQWSMGWTTMPEVFTSAQPLLDEWAATVDVTQPDQATEAFFPMIARYGTAFNLILPKKVREPEVEPWRTLFGAEWTPALDAAAKAGLLYVIDFRIYETLQPQMVDGLPRFTPSTVTVLVQNPATKALTPELVRVAGGNNEPQIFSRQGSTTAPAWVYALQAAKVSVTVFGIWFGHVYQWHLVTAAMLMTMFDNLPADHRVRKLLEPHSSYVIPFDNILLMDWASLVPPTSITTARQFVQLIDRYASTRQFFDDDPTTTLERLGITESDFTVHEPWDQYPVVRDLLEIWNATGRYVSTYVERAYKTDRDVQQDAELQSWILDSGREDRGNIRGLGIVDSREALKPILHSLIYRVTAHGGSRLYRTANPAFTFVANFPPTLHDATIPDPTSSFDTKALHRFLPRTGTIGAMLQFVYPFWASTPYVPFVPLVGVDRELFFEDTESNEALIELRRFIIGFVERFEPDTPQIWQWERNIET